MTRARQIQASLLGISLLGALLVFGEITLRNMEAHVVSLKANQFLTSPELLIDYTPQGRRLIPNAEVMIKNHRLSKRDIPIKINSLGFRDEESQIPKPSDEYRILMLGDSITWGDYLPAQEVYVEQAEAILNQRVFNHHISIINAGVGDIGLKEELDILKEKGLRLTPDIVLVGFYLNDSRPPWGFPGEIGHRGWLRSHSVLAESVYKKAALLRWIRSKGTGRFEWVKLLKTTNWKHERDDFTALAKAAKYDWGSAWQPESWAIITSHLKELRSLSLNHHFRVGIVTFPVWYQIESDFLENSPQIQLKSIARDLGFPILDLLPMLRQNRQSDLYFDQAHPNQHGNALIGRAVADFVQTNFIQK
ncbi:MAG: lysophospholipase L1-like esterase [Candidatus Marinamargulisbacteria bacterium]|jgi:lysophospholipase L1-like esterase